MNLLIRTERKQDYKVVRALIREAFLDEEFSDNQEHHLVARLRESSAFIPELSLVAESNNIIVGHILLTKVRVINADKTFDSLALAPVSVLPDYQGRGIGSALITKAHEIAVRLGFHSVMLIGHSGYYPKFAYKPAHIFGIKFPFNVPAENCMALELQPGSLKNVSGTVKYPKEFFS